jgi:hypothetical protein
MPPARATDFVAGCGNGVDRGLSELAHLFWQKHLPACFPKNHITFPHGVSLTACIEAALDLARYDSWKNVRCSWN